MDSETVVIMEWHINLSQSADHEYFYLRRTKIPYLDNSLEFELIIFQEYIRIYVEIICKANFSRHVNSKIETELLLIFELTNLIFQSSVVINKKCHDKLFPTKLRKIYWGNIPQKSFHVFNQLKKKYRTKLAELF